MIFYNKTIIFWIITSISSILCASSFNSFSSVQFLPTTFDRFVSSSASLNPSSKLFSSNNRLTNIQPQQQQRRPDYNWNFRRNFQLNSPLNNNYLFNGVNTLPKFSTGFSNSDPYFLNGPQAKNLANYLYSKELFFNDIPHVRSLLRNQDERRFNGLPLHRMGSLRFSSPWYRFDRKTTNPFFI